MASGLKQDDANPFYRHNFYLPLFYPIESCFLYFFFRIPRLYCVFSPKIENARWGLEPRQSREVEASKKKVPWVAFSSWLTKRGIIVPMVLPHRGKNYDSITRMLLDLQHRTP